MPMKASTSGRSVGSSSRKRCGRQPETIKPWPRFWASRSSEDSRMASTLSSWAASMKEQVLTMTTSALAASLVISTPLFTSEPSIISASTRFLAQPREISPTRTGFLSFSVTGRTSYAMELRVQPWFSVIALSTGQTAATERRVYRQRNECVIRKPLHYYLRRSLSSSFCPSYSDAEYFSRAPEFNILLQLMKTLIAVIGLFVIAGQSVLGFGDQGHKAIWTAAQ